MKNKTLTNEQFSLEQSIKIYLQLLKDDYPAGPRKVLEQNHGQLRTEDDQVKGIIELADTFLKFLNKK